MNLSNFVKIIATAQLLRNHLLKAYEWMKSEDHDCGTPMGDGCSTCIELEDIDTTIKMFDRLLKEEPNS